jgi:hypothetical protein
MQTNIEIIELYKREFILKENSSPQDRGKKRYTHKKGLNNIAQVPQLGTRHTGQ